MNTPAPARGQYWAYRWLGVSVLLGAGLVTMVLALSWGGGVAQLLVDSGPVVRWGLPSARLINSLSAAVMLGPLVFALFALRPGEATWGRTLDWASAGAAVFTLSSGAVGFFTFLNVFNPKLSAGQEFGEQFGRFLTTLPLGQAWLITTVMGAVITVLLFAWRTWTPVLLTAVVAGMALLPAATQGHAGDLDGHVMAVNSVFLHTIAAAVWLGGLVALMVVRGATGGLATSVRRYSSLAIAAFAVLAVSGVARSTVSVGSWERLWSPYGAILVVKVIALLALGLFGAWYRIRIIPLLPRGQHVFWAFVVVELAIMGLASGAAAALARTPPPSAQVNYARTPAEILTGRPLPVEFTPDRWLTAWHPDILWLVVAGLALFFYGAGVWRLHRRGDRWPIYRTTLWTLGVLSLVWVTCGPMNEYQETLFSVHMMGHMALSMAIPMLLVFGAPVTLALRAVHKRDDGTRGGREWIMWAIHSPYGRFITNPFVAAGIFIVSLWAFYFSDLVRWAMVDHLGHEWMIIHFLISGYLFVLTLVGIDPVPNRLPYIGRVLTLIGIMAMHAFFGMAIMMQEGLMVAEWFGAMGRTWGPTPMEDQYIGGGIAWSIGEIPTLILGTVVAIQWSRSDDKLQRREDRHADRTGEAELKAYNDELAALAKKDTLTGS